MLDLDASGFGDGIALECGFACAPGGDGQARDGGCGGDVEEWKELRQAGRVLAEDPRPKPDALQLANARL